jgi:hypothetical protein
MNKSIINENREMEARGYMHEGDNQASVAAALFI